MLYKKKPCEGCWEICCEGKACPRWQVWFLEAWEAVNRYGWQAVDQQGRQEPEKFQYELPHMIRSPCMDCPLEAWCDRPCSKRLKWWDKQVERIRKKRRTQNAECEME